MGKIIVTGCEIEGLYVIEPTVYADSRGYFFESYNEADFIKAGIDKKFVQDNQSMSLRGVLRGLHFQKEHPQAKLVRVISGEVYDVAVDLRKGSATFGKYFGVILSAENKKQFFIPEGFAHGFLVRSDEAIFTYKVDNVYAPQAEACILWKDEDINVDWNVDEKEIVMSEKDLRACCLREAEVFE